ncbi:MAG: hypothetical protein ACYC3O_13205 [Burkholderiales bacterium]
MDFSAYKEDKRSIKGDIKGDKREGREKGREKGEKGTLPFLEKGEKEKGKRGRYPFFVCANIAPCQDYPEPCLQDFRTMLPNGVIGARTFFSQTKIAKPI